jgi:hypothetical protein
MRHHIQKCPTDGVGVGVESGPQATLLGGVARTWRRVRGASVAALRSVGAATRERVHPKQTGMERLERTLEAMCANLDTLHGRIHELEMRGAPAVPGRSTMSLNLTTKNQALKLFRNGQDARQIARTLGVAVGEIELLLKVQRMQSCAELRRRERKDEASAKAPAEQSGGMAQEVECANRGGA